MRLIITGGGTGGHLFPGIAVAESIQQRVPGSRVLFIGTDRPIDRLALDAVALERATIACAGLKGKSLFARLEAVVQLPRALLQAAGILRSFRPDLVFGVGGYVTGPVVLAARLQGIPVCIHEQNSVPGLANRLCGRVADRVFLSIPCSPAFAQGKTLLAGNPVRREILAAAASRKDRRDQPLTILVLGGSQGAHRVNLLMVAAMKQLRQGADYPFRVVHQTGLEDAAFVSDAYDAVGVDAEVQPFFSRMAEVYSEADLVVSRAGATTLAELAVMGLPTLLIPYPHAADDHQAINARYYASGGGAKVLGESETNPETLCREVDDLLRNRAELHTMAANMQQMGLPHAADTIVDSCLDLLESR